MEKTLKLLIVIITGTSIILHQLKSNMLIFNCESIYFSVLFLHLNTTRFFQNRLLVFANLDNPHPCQLAASFSSRAFLRRPSPEIEPVLWPAVFCILPVDSEIVGQTSCTPAIAMAALSLWAMVSCWVVVWLSRVFSFYFFVESAWKNTEAWMTPNKAQFCRACPFAG
jgi:hypothetical protein